MKNSYPKLYDYLLKICYSALDLTAFYHWFYGDAAWEEMQTKTSAMADSLGLTGLSLPEREAMRVLLGEEDREAFIELMEQWIDAIKTEKAHFFK